MKKERYLMVLIAIVFAVLAGGDSDVRAAESRSLEIAQVKNVNLATNKNFTYTNVRWDNVKNASGYIVYRRTTSKGKFVKIADVKKNSYKDSGVKLYNTYYYRIRAYRIVNRKKQYGALSGITSRCSSARAVVNAGYAFGNLYNWSNNRKDWYCGQDEKKIQSKYKKFNVEIFRENNKKIYLTFNCAYDNGNTVKILNILKKNKVKAVFFVCMQFAKGEPALMRRIIKEGHILGNHSASHPDNGMCSISMASQKEDIRRLNAYVKSKYGYTMKLFRFPSGTYSMRCMALVSSMRMTSVFWTYTYKDWNPYDQPGTVFAYNSLLKGLKPGAVYQLHAVSSTNVAVLGKFINTAKAKGYKFESYY